jgi:hypothetical protein
MREKLPNQLCDKIYSYLGMSDTGTIIKEINYEGEASKLFLNFKKDISIVSTNI